nr:unnamed protein product [Callosobruchus analis]
MPSLLMDAGNCLSDHVRKIRGLSYKLFKKEHRQAIKASKLSCWRKLIAEVDEDIWGKGYRIVFVTLRMESSLPETSLEKKKKIVQPLFPNQAKVTLITSPPQMSRSLQEMS